MIDVVYNIILIIMIGILGYFLISVPAAESSARSLETQRATTDDSMDLIKTIRGRRSVDEKIRRKDELWGRMVESSVGEQRDAIERVKEISEAIDGANKTLESLTQRAMMTDSILEQQDRALLKIKEIFTEMSSSAEASFEEARDRYEALLDDMEQASEEISVASQSAREVREWLDGH